MWLLILLGAAVVVGVIIGTVLYLLERRRAGGYPIRLLPPEMRPKFRQALKSLKKRGPAPERTDVYSLDKLPPALLPRAEEIQNSVRLCVRLTPVRTDEEMDPAASKFGGQPCIGEDDPWPTSESGKPMTFIGQLNFAELTATLAEKAQTPPAGLPEEGMFVFFYDLEEMRWGFDPKDSGFWCFRWIPDPARIVPVKNIPEQQWPSEPCKLVPEVGDSLPTYGDEVACPADLSDPEWQGYFELCEDVLPKVDHQLLGHPNIIQNDPRFTAQLASNGFYCGDHKSVQSIPHLDELRKGLSDWHLLWQIDTDEAPGFMWGDAGRLYIMIRHEDLQAGRLERVWMELQCY